MTRKDVARQNYSISVLWRVRSAEVTVPGARRDGESRARRALRADALVAFRLVGGGRGPERVRPAEVFDGLIIATGPPGAALRRIRSPTGKLLNRKLRPWAAAQLEGKDQERA